MADQSAIEWTDATWNPVTGCDRVSPGCAHCYALDLAARLKAMGNNRYQHDGDPKSSGPGFGVTLHSDVLGKPLRWRKPRMVFVNSMSDLFHEAVPDSYIAEVFAVMSVAGQHTFQVLTKRPGRMRDLLSSTLFTGQVERARRARGFSTVLPWPLPNVWLGVSIENRQFVNRADLLRQAPAAVRFISAEPLLGPLVPTAKAYGEFPATWLAPGGRIEENNDRGLDLTEIDWLIVGGESGPKHRPVDPQWVRDLADACRIDRQGTTAFFFKQWGGRTPKSGGRLLDGLTWDEFPSEAVRA